MKLNFCTLFDSNYLSRGLVMYKSLSKHCPDFHLYIFAFDDKSFDLLTKMKLEHVTVITLKEFENERLLSVKPTRTRAEYCWTCTSSTILYVLETYKAENCTYIDADLFFYSNPENLFNELGSSSVLITEHRFTAKYDRSQIAGKYCVQFITFKNNAEGMAVLKWWSDACLDWCYDRYEDGKFGDQKYLDDWTTRFKGVHVLQHLGGGLAPWNIQQYAIVEPIKEKIMLKCIEKESIFEAVFYHFHYVRFYKNELVDLGWFKLTKQITSSVYAPYVSELEEAMKQIKKIDPSFTESLRPFSILDSDGLKNKLKIVIKLVLRINLYRISDLLKLKNGISN